MRGVGILVGVFGGLAALAGAFAASAQDVSVGLTPRPTGTNSALKLEARNASCERPQDFRFDVSDAPFVRLEGSDTVRGLGAGESGEIRAIVDYTDVPPGTYEGAVRVVCDTCQFLVFTNCRIDDRLITLRHTVLPAEGPRVGGPSVEQPPPGDPVDALREPPATAPSEAGALNGSPLRPGVEDAASLTWTDLGVAPFALVPERRPSRDVIFAAPPRVEADGRLRPPLAIRAPIPDGARTTVGTYLDFTNEPGVFDEPRLGLLCGQAGYGIPDALVTPLDPSEWPDARRDCPRAEADALMLAEAQRRIAELEAELERARRECEETRRLCERERAAADDAERRAAEAEADAEDARRAADEAQEDAEEARENEDPLREIRERRDGVSIPLDSTFHDGDEVDHRDWPMIRLFVRGNRIEVHNDTDRYFDENGLEGGPADALRDAFRRIPPGGINLGPLPDGRTLEDEIDRICEPPPSIDDLKANGTVVNLLGITRSSGQVSVSRRNGQVGGEGGEEAYSSAQNVDESQITVDLTVSCTWEYDEERNEVRSRVDINLSVQWVENGETREVKYTHSDPGRGYRID